MNENQTEQIYGDKSIISTSAPIAINESLLDANSKEMESKDSDLQRYRIMSQRQTLFERDFAVRSHPYSECITEKEYDIHSCGEKLNSNLQTFFIILKFMVTSG